ncbi:hypothetical protein ACQ86N_41425 [Puia sp. P3]|uniref:F0F1 ATP synthase subunit B family protein n=1 Tax=Puia sp. P3 TaxID=3423952 RepID=UPI003D672547
MLTPDLGLFVWNVIIFLFLLIILRKLARKPILKSLKERETGIADSLASAEKIKAGNGPDEERERGIAGQSP